MTRLLMLAVLVAGCGKMVLLASEDASPGPIDGATTGDGMTGDAHQPPGDGSVSFSRCPCVSNSTCDSLSQCAADGLCEPLLPFGDCGASGQACCGGTCGSCGVGLLCADDATCQPVTGGGTLGDACTLNCNGTSNCDPGQYCPNSCTTCPCINTCHLQVSMCTLGDDDSCVANPANPPIIHHCAAETGPFATKCVCVGATDPVTGKCM